MSILSSFFDLPELTPKGFCLNWDPGLIWLNAGFDALIMLSYLSIPMSLVGLLRRRRNRIYSWIGYLFVVFPLADATAHALAILMLWVPAYGIYGLAKGITAAASVTTALVLWLMAPRLAGTPSPAQLTDLNAELSQTVAHQQVTLHNLLDIGHKLRNSNSALERDVSRHTEGLHRANAQLLKFSAERVVTQELLAKNEAEYQASFDAATIGKVQIEPLSGRLLRVNGAFADILGYQVKDLVGREIWDLAYPDDRAGAHARFNKLLVREIDHWVMESRLVRRDGLPVWVRISATVVIDPALGVPRLALAEIEDLDGRHDIQAALRATETRLRLALDSAGFGIWEFDIRNGLFWADDRSSAMTDGEVPANTWHALTGPKYAAWVKRIHPDDRDRREAQLQALFAGETRVVQIEDRVRRADSGWSNLSHRCAVVERDVASGIPIRAVGVITDVSERVAALTEAQTAKASLERDLEKRKAALAHRHLLLREVYHRVNETLQNIDRLFAVQARQVGGREPSEALLVLRSRIDALGIVLGVLTKSVDIGSFDIAPFVDDLCDAVAASHGDRGISLRVDAAHVEVTLDYAIPLGLLVAELLANCLKHTSPEGDAQVAVTLVSTANAEIALTVSASGAGPAEAPLSASFASGLGTRLVRGLVYQLGAQLKVVSEGGLGAEVTIAHRVS